MLDFYVNESLNLPKARRNILHASMEAGKISSSNTNNNKFEKLFAKEKLSAMTPYREGQQTPLALDVKIRNANLLAEQAGRLKD